MAEITRKQLVEIFYPEELKDGEEKKNFSLPIRWKGGDFYRELYFLFEEYQKRIGNRLPGDEYEKIREDVRAVCQKVCLAVSESFRGNPSKAYDAVDDALKLLTKKYPCYIGLKELRNYPLYRAVDVKDKAVHDRKRVFHVPFNLRSKMSTTRYSIPGYPALYLGTSIELNCAEIHKSPQDDTVMAARFEYEDEEKGLVSTFLRQLCLIDLSVKPQDFRLPGIEKRSLRQSWLIGDKADDPVRSLLKRPEYYLLWYPLIAACSYIRINREDPYAAEYVVPQLVTQWAKRMDAPPQEDIFSFIKALYGVCYFSCLSEKASEKGLNFAFPSSGSDVWTFDELKNYCPVLAANFRLTEPVFVAEYESPKECENALDNDLETARIGEFSKAAIKKEITDKKGVYEIPAGEDTVPDWTFSNIEELIKIYIPNGVTSIGDGAFSGCTGLTDIEIPNSVTSIGSGILNRCSDLQQITVCEGNGRYYGINNCIIEKNSGELICGCKESIIPNDGSVTSIGSLAFYGCTGLKDITIPNSVTSIGYRAFSGCTGLKDITIPNSVTSIGDFAFTECIGLPDIEIPNGVTNIGNYAFAGCAGLTGIKIPTSVTSIGNSAFSDCTVLTDIEIPNNVTIIGNRAFKECIGLKDIEIPNSVTHIGDWAFYGCTGLKNLEIPNSVTNIGDWAFAGCNKLNIRVPKRFKKRNSRTFEGCQSVFYY